MLRRMMKDVYNIKAALGPSLGSYRERVPPEEWCIGRPLGFLLPWLCPWPPSPIPGCVPGRLALALAAPGPSLAQHNYSPFSTPACIPCPSPPSLAPGRKGPFSRQSASTDGKSSLPDQVGSQFDPPQNEDLGLLYRSLPSVPPRTSI